MTSRHFDWEVAKSGGFPKKYGNPRLKVVHDTLTGTLHYDEELVSLGTMSYKTENLIANPTLHAEMRNPEKNHREAYAKTQINLKFILPWMAGQQSRSSLPIICVMPKVKGAWSGHARLHLVPHVNAPVADFPVRKIIGGSHFIADITLPYGRVIHDYMKEENSQALQERPYQRSQQEKDKKAKVLIHGE